MRRLICLLAFCGLASGTLVSQAKNVPPPASCIPQVNQSLQNLINSGTKKDVDNIMVCGDAVGNTTFQPAGPSGTGSHHVTTLTVTLPNGRNVQVEVVTNDQLDGVVTANPGDHVAAYGQGYLTTGKWQAGVHDVHCSTDAGQNNGWVYINGKAVTPSCSN